MISDNHIANLLISSSPEGILVINKSGEIVKVNDSLLDMFGYSSETELIGKKMEILIPNKYLENHQKHREGYAKKPSKRRMGTDKVLFGKRKDGEEFAVEVGLNHITQDDELFISALISDISERIKIQDELKNLNKELESKVTERTVELENAILELQETYNSLELQYEKTSKAEREAQKSLAKEKELGELKTRFVSMASHEFRTPLSAVLSSNSLISKYLDKLGLDDTEKSKITKHTSRIENSVKNLNEILNDLLSLGKIEEGKIEVNRSEFSVISQIDEVTEELSTYLKNGQKVVHSHSGDEMVLMDKHLLHNILLNLTSNASKYSSENDEIRIATRVDNSKFYIEIVDKGIGIPLEDHQHMFDRFFRAKNVTNIQGTGLGLNIVKKYVELMNGTINFTSKLNEGSTFTIEFNL